MHSDEKRRKDNGGCRKEDTTKDTRGNITIQEKKLENKKGAEDSYPFREGFGDEIEMN